MANILYSCTNLHAHIDCANKYGNKRHKMLTPPSCHHKYMIRISHDLMPDTRDYSKLCVYEASFPPLLKHLLNCHSHLSNCIISFIFLLLCPEYESIMSCGCPPKLSLAP